MTKKIISLTVLSLCIQRSLYAQYSSEYLQIIEKINPPIDSIKVEEKFSNGKLELRAIKLITVRMEKIIAI